MIQYSKCAKRCFSTLGLNEFMLINWMKHSKGGMTPSTTARNRVRQNGVTTRDLATTDKKKHLEGYVNQLPKLPSHYCRKNTLKTYLEPTFKSSMSDIYKEYAKQCAALNPPQKPLSRFTFDLVIKEKNIAFQPPKKDRCDLCISYETGNAKEEEYQKHQAKKEKARAEKLKDKNDAKEGISTVLTMDLQAVKVTPSLNASALYYNYAFTISHFII
ncbi:unnamed protein product [Pieris macdunnoughi]|uniref:Uncharacterized protein n=1 Tax=Pieris macdunnoughi TaxID=345717 RepID=A0A821N5B3_9NEOP|nr:unnamed protein product [Pieris macdunnoughi]